jgi:hypothetical protein
MLASDPECGGVMQGTGGVRKVRVAVGGRGKSGGARVIYYFHGSDLLPILIFAVFTKNEKRTYRSSRRQSRRAPSSETHERGNIMAGKAFRAIEAGMKDAIAYLDGDKTKGVATLRNWEQGRTRPDGPARVLLTVIDRDPRAVLKALRIGAKPAAARAKRVRSAARLVRLAEQGRHRCDGPSAAASPPASW